MDAGQTRQATPISTVTTIPQSDRELVDAVLNGETEAFRVLVDRESRTVVAACSAILRNPDEAQDVAQDAFVQAYRSLAGYRGDGTFGAWIARIATRMAVQRASALRRNSMPELPDDLYSQDRNGDPELQLMDLEHSDALRAAIRNLPADQREVVALRFYSDMPIEQIALQTGIPAGTVKSRLHRALQRLRDQHDLRSVS
jgi:RNA polymerase sigma-70 factor, ECF subfamily